MNIRSVKQSVHILSCEKVFAEDLKRMDEENEILLQTGILDTTNEHPPLRVAIVYVGKNMVTLIFEKSYKSGAEISEVYKAEGYNLRLTYEETKNKYGNPIYNGTFVVETAKSKSEFDVMGHHCNL